MLLNRQGNGAEEMRRYTGSYYANADFSKIEGIVAQVQAEVASVIGADMMAAIEKYADEGINTDIVDAACRAVAYMAAMRYFRLNDISHETDGRKVKMDSENERRPFEWQLERDDRMHLEEYHRALGTLIALLFNDDNFKKGSLYARLSALLVPNAACFGWATGIETSTYLFFRLIPFLTEAQRYVAKRYGKDWQATFFPDSTDSDPAQGQPEEMLLYKAQAAIAHRALALFVRRTEMTALPAGVFRQAIGDGSTSLANTTEQLHDYYSHEMTDSEVHLNDLLTLRDELSGNVTTRLQMPDNEPKNKFFRL